MFLLWHGTFDEKPDIVSFIYGICTLQFSSVLFMEDSQLCIAFLFFLPENKYIYLFAYLIFNMLELGVYSNVRSWHLFLLKGMQWDPLVHSR